MALNPNIILSGQQFDLMGAMDRGMQLANNRNALARQREMEQLYRTQGNALMQGDVNALGQLAQLDPMVAQDMLAQKQDMDFSAETMAMRREAARVATAEKLAAEAATLTAEQLAAEREALSGALQGGAFFYQKQDKAGYEAFLRSKGIDPAEYPFEAFPAHAADVEGVLEALDKFAAPDPTKGAPTGFMFNDPRNPAAGVAPLPGFTKTPDTVVNIGGEGGPQTQIGSIPQGFAAVVDGNSPAGYRFIPIPGGPEDTSKSSAAAAEGSLQQSNIVLDKIGQAKDLIANSAWYNPATGFGAQKAAQVGGTNAANYKAVTDTIEANIAFDSLAAMREASPTGGALGAISERELVLLGATLASLSQAQDPEQAARHLAELEAIYKQIMAKAAAYPNASEFGFGSATPPAATGGDMSDEDLLRLYGGE
jgi:hypothetical protein